MAETKGEFLHRNTIDDVMKSGDNHSADQLASQDEHLASLLRKSINAEQLITLHPVSKPEAMHINCKAIGIIETRYKLQNQQSRGAWFHPEKASLKVGFINLPYHHYTHPEFAMNIVLEEKISLKLNSSESILIWGALEPLSLTLFEPFSLLSANAIKLPKAKREKAFEKAKKALLLLGLLEKEINKLQLDSNWLRKSVEEKQELKLQYLNYLRMHDPFEIITRFRLVNTQILLKRFYQKRKTQNATQSNVLTKQNARTLAGFYGGDWLEFLNYIEEKSETGDVIQYSLPKPEVMTGISVGVVNAAKEMGLEPEQIKEVATSLFPEAAGLNPIQQREKALKNFWRVFTELHSKQKPGMPSLWGFVHQIDRIEIPASISTRQIARFGSPAQYKTYLPQEVQKAIELLWATRVIAKYPDRLVTNLTPYYWMAKALGPALEFWEGAFLTAWYITEGPYSRTDLANMETYYKKLTDPLKHLGTPVSPKLFEELRRAESKLGAPEFINENQQKIKGERGINIEVSFGGWERREGFVLLKNIILKHFKTWSENYFDDYLEKQWKQPLEDLSEKLSKRLVSKGKPFTLKQFSKMTESIANTWFGGDLTAVSVAVLQPSPVTQERKRAIHKDVTAHANYVYAQWQSLAQKHNLKTDLEDYQDQRLILQSSTLTQLSFSFLQFAEAIGRQPTEDEFKTTLKSYSKDEIHRLLSGITKTHEESWKLFINVSKSKLKTSSQNILSPPSLSKNNAITNQVANNSGHIKTPQKEEKKVWWKRLIDRHN